MKHYYLVAFGILWLFYGCLDKQNFSEIPAIKFENTRANPTNGSIDLNFSFTDGDGDLGLKQSENYYPYGPCHPHYYNLFIDPYFLEDGIFKLGKKFNDTNCDSLDQVKVGYYYRMTYIVPEGKDKSLEGDVTVNLNGVLMEFPQDTIKFKIWIVDRAFHTSNIVETGLIITP